MLPMDHGTTVATNVRLPAELLEELRARAFREGRSLAALFREALQRYLRPEAPPGDPLAGFIGSFDSGVGDLGVEHDHYLYGWPKQAGAARAAEAPHGSYGEDPRRHQRAGGARRSRRRKT